MDKQNRDVDVLAARLAKFAVTPAPPKTDPNSFEEMQIVGTCTEYEKKYFRLTSVIIKIILSNDKY